MSDLENAIRRVQKFFFDEEVPFGLALCRICLPLVLMGMVFPRWPVCRELYSADGATGQLSVGFGYIDMLPEFSGTVVAALYAVLMFAMVTLSIGFCSRISALIVCVLMTYFSMLDSEVSGMASSIDAVLYRCGLFWCRHHKNPYSQFFYG